MNKRQRKKQDKNLVNFNAMKSYIKAMAQNGIPKSIWGHIAKRIWRGKYFDKELQTRNWRV